VQAFIVKRQPRRRCRFPRRPHPDIEFFFSRYDRSRLDIDGSDDDAGADHECADLQARLPNRH
jgi:hypothetical protein